MNGQDYIYTGLENIWRNRLRSTLTIIGVAVAVGALISMLSFSIGLQQNIVEGFQQNQLMKQIVLKESDVEDKGAALLTDSVIDNLKKKKHIVAAFEEMTSTVRIDYQGESKSGFVRALPYSFENYFAEDQYFAGEFFSCDSCPEILLSKSAINDLLKKTDSTLTKTAKDSIITLLIGQEIDVVTMTYDAKSFNMFSMMNMMQTGKPPVRDSVLIFRIAGIIEGMEMFGSFGQIGFVTQKNLSIMPSLGFENVVNLLSADNSGSGRTVNVYVDKIENLSEVQEVFKTEGYQARSVLDNFKEVKKVFAVINGILGAIGIMALFIATLGLVNTMIMSIYERTREIGILKSLGAKIHEIKFIFILEAGIIGFLGAIIGIPAGWGVTKLAELIFINELFKEFDEKVELFSFPPMLIFSAIAFSIIVAMLSGLYPANRAAKIDPVIALRHD